MTKKKIGMMQPYLFPYLGYFQLMSAVDVFVLGDDLQYVKESWINRNRILMNGTDKLITFPLKKGKYLSRINERVLSDDFSAEADKLLRVIFNAYARAPQYKKVIPFLEALFKYPEKSLAKYAEHSIRRIAEYLGIKTEIVIASDLCIGEVVDKQDRVIKTAKKLNGEVYINLIGGVDLYDFDLFEEHGLKLVFHRINDISYPQFGNEFVPLLSIIDVLMFNEMSEVQRKLNCYSLLDSANNPVSRCDQCEPCRRAGPASLVAET
ncbi:MAG TPA: WbqC family protein [Noviherbaspirillum sp.]|nr:WbqC family protein [Noviherbaspirillum sp.]